MKKKIIIFTYSLRIGGGAERIISSLTQKLSKKYEFYILTIQEFNNIYPIKGKYYSLNEKSMYFTKFLTYFKIYLLIRPIRFHKFIKSISPHLIISFLDLPNIYAIITKLLFSIKIPLIISIRCNPRRMYKKEMRYLNFLIRTLYPLKLVNKIITVSKGVEMILENDYSINKNKLKTIYNSIDIEKIIEMKGDRISKFNKLFHDTNIIKFITIGRLRKVKGHQYLIDAFYEVKKQVPNSKLIILGEGPLRHELEEKIKVMGLHNDVHLLGLKKNPYKYLAKSDIFVFSSKYEGFPNVLLEALACGLPIISTDCETGPREILGNGKYGILVNVMDIKDLKDKMILLAKNKDIKEKYSKLSTERAKYFNIQKDLIKWINLIESEMKANI